MSTLSFTNEIFMVRPARFGFNAETAVNNAFQTEAEQGEADNIAQSALKEFDEMVEQLRIAGVTVHVWEDKPEPVKPDAVFPNNWISTTPEGMLITYPMYAVNRRPERDEQIIEWIAQRYSIDRRYAMEHYEVSEKYLESTGSILFDHDHNVMYACLSERTYLDLLQKLGVLIGYRLVWFHAVDASNMAIYHTNVMMCLGAGFAVVCLESIRDHEEKSELLSSLKEGGREVVDITYDQMAHYAGNMIQLMNKDRDPVLVMSDQAYKSLRKDQLAMLENHSSIVHPEITTIETYGGGSARCMIAEIFLGK